ncbi:hypothetical protein N7492_003664 [Penicillium capsulatum]|uniref:RGS domain-containing protein n=1 Tax=Penicillium capsulatum TaxID=69766 RepID=A0A9W9IMB1_9EURO|nr:hypothetical protein N7492_003664 [Penicillium capsulatum]KAJ6121755.1 hypothetical protein N7512_004220 [Penicillium capsulatum]
MGSELGVTADSTAALNFSSISVFWIVFGNVWTVAVVAGMVYLIVNRNSPTMRLRGIGLSMSAIVFLHLYLWVCQYGLMVGTLEPPVVQYWIMGIYLPTGIALFQASNSRFLHVAKLQKRYFRPESRLDRPSDAPGNGGLIARFKRLNYNTRMLITVGISLAFQLSLTVLMYLISRKYHSSWGVPGTEVTGTPMEQMTEMGRGWEWWPGVLSQFFWSWVIAPYVLWKSRNIQDTQGWRIQTIGCAIANLPATPMWLIALYVDGMAPVNKVWLPPQWICMSIFFIEIFTVFLPCWEVARHQVLRQETLNLISQWEVKTKGSNSDLKSLASGSTVVGSLISGIKSFTGSVKSKDSSRDSILTMGALESVLERNPTPLQKYSALNDFSGENIAFLTSVHEWKSSLPKAAWGSPATQDAKVKELVRERFNRALHIYAEFISVRHAEFPINISSQDLKKLEAIFEGPARLLYGEEREVDPVTPFDMPIPEPAYSPTYSEFSEKASQSTISAIKDRVQFWGEVPEAFDATIFDAAEESIKYLVLTNTWPKFLRDRRASVDSSATLEVTEIV